MSILQSLLVGVAEADARSTLYYIGRYVKQAGYFEEYGKDIFDDEERSAPSDNVKELARQMIVCLEEREGCSAAKFSESRVIEILDEITSLEAALGPEVSGDDLLRAGQFVSSIRTPVSRE